MYILDLGVGGGRTTAYLSSIAGQYVRVDYVPEMVEACRAEYPRLEFQTSDAIDRQRESNHAARASCDVLEREGLASGLFSWRTHSALCNPFPVHRRGQRKAWFPVIVGAWG